MPGGPMPPGFFQGPPGSQQSPHAQPPPHNPSNPMMGPHGQPFMSPRYPGGPRPSLRMPNQVRGIVFPYCSLSFPYLFSLLCFLSLQVESPDLSLSCPTVWTRQDRRVSRGTSDRRSWCLD
ncbi:unnamed protein product [Tetraodon nigroviridis]|uniref:(spotted green pufferfish) hypothetical protein n=1 Tax=Tetraodon nigroviridis TaxID=99883 RepID=Q4RMP2_TETNG|nr:unnamed protein product [Tetraodon nigroviridis]